MYYRIIVGTSYMYRIDRTLRTVRVPTVLYTDSYVLYGTFLESLLFTVETLLSALPRAGVTVENSHSTMNQVRPCNFSRGGSAARIARPVTPGIRALCPVSLARFIRAY